MVTPRKRPEDKLKVGRPSLYKPENCELVISFGKQGFSKVQMAAKFDVDKSTIDYWRDTIPEFSEALTRALTYSQTWWEEQASAGLKDRNFNANLWLKVVASRFRDDYADRKELTGAGGGPIQQTVTLKTLDVSGLDDEQLDALETALETTLGKN